MPHYISYTTDIPGGHTHVHQHLRMAKETHSHIQQDNHAQGLFQASHFQT